MGPGQRAQVAARLLRRHQCHHRPADLPGRQGGERTPGPALARLHRGRLPLWVAAFAAGIFLARPAGPAAYLAAAACATAALFLALRARSPALVTLAVAAAGFATGDLRQAARLLDLERGRIDPPAREFRLLGQIRDLPERLPDRAILWVEAEARRAGPRWEPLAGRLRLAVPGPVRGLARGDRLVTVLTLDRPAFYRNPGAFDYAAFLARRGVTRVAWCRDPRLLVRVAGPPGPFRLLDLGRERYAAWLNSSATDGGALLAALLAGDRADLPEAAQESFNRTGLAHLLSVSGLHLAMVAAVFIFAADLLWRRSARLCNRLAAPRAAALLSIPPVTVYALLTGMSLPTQRALVMALSFLLAAASDRARGAWNALVLAAAVSLFVWPEALLETSFVLSYLAVAGILYLYPRLTAAARRRRSAAEIELDRFEVVLGVRSGLAARLGAYTLSVLALTFAAQWAVTPATLEVFHRSNPFGLLYNLVAVPFTGLLLMPAGMAATAAAAVSPDLAAPLLLVAAWLGEVLVLGVQSAAALPGAALLPSLGWAGTAAWYLGGAGAVEAALALRRGDWSWRIFSPAARRERLFNPERRPTAGRRRPMQAAAAVSAALLLIAVLRLAAPRCSFPRGALAAIDVGQGQALLLRGADGRLALIDGGGSYDPAFDTGEKVVAPCLLALGITRLDAVILTHAHPDHVRGLSFILRNFRVGQFWLPAGAGEAAEELRTIAAERAVPVRELAESPEPERLGGLRFLVLHPPAGYAAANENNRSLVLRVEDGRVAALLPGDVERDVESLLVRKYGPAGAVGRDRLRAPVLVAPHHGSRTSSTVQFLEAVAPRVALISAAGRRRGGLPANEVVDRYRGMGIELWETDRQGMVGVVMEPGPRPLFLAP